MNFAPGSLKSSRLSSSRKTQLAGVFPFDGPAHPRWIVPGMVNDNDGYHVAAKS